MKMLEDVVIRSAGGSLVIGTRADPIIRLWQKALRQEGLTFAMRVALQDGERSQAASRRLLENRLDLLPPRMQPDDATSVRRLADAIRHGRLSAIFLPADLTLLAADAMRLDLPPKTRTSLGSSSATVQRVVAMFESGPGLGEASRQMREAVTGRDMSLLADLLIAAVLPDPADPSAFLDAPLAAWAYWRAGRPGLEALEGMVTAVRAVVDLRRPVQIDPIAIDFYRATKELGPALFAILLNRRTRRGALADSDERSTPVRVVQRQRSGTAAAPDTDSFPDNDRQAQALQTAARDGTPFCEVCSR